VGYSWIDQLKLEAERTVTDLQMKFAASRFPQSTPLTKVIITSSFADSGFCLGGLGGEMVPFSPVFGIVDGGFVVG
jgi:hypothetical protein